MKHVSPSPSKPLSLFPMTLAAVTLAVLVSPAALGGAHIEKSVDVPRDTKIPVGITYEKASIDWVETHNAPTEKEIQDAETKDPKDRHWILFRFYYQNAGYVKHKVQLRVVLFDQSGTVLAEGGRKSALDPQEKDDTISFPVQIRTADWPRARRVKVLATVLN